MADQKKRVTKGQRRRETVAERAKRYPVMARLVKEFVDPETGETHARKRDLKRAVSQRHELILREFAAMVRDGNLGLDPWERLPMETPVEYGRFLSYLRLGPDYPEPGPGGQLRRSYAARSVKRTAHHLGLDPRTLQRHAERFHWELRGDCWQRHLDSQELTALERERNLACARQQRLGRRLQNLALAGIEVISQDLDRIAELTPIELVKLADTGVKIERASDSQAGKVEDNSLTIIWNGKAPSWAGTDEPKTIEGKA